VITLAVAAAIHLLGVTLPERCYHLFSYPSAKIAALFLNAQLTFVEGVYLVADSRIVLHITKKCSASTFFIILFSLLCFQLVAYKGLRGGLRLFPVMVLSYPITVVANAMRIIAWRLLFPYVDKLTTPAFESAVHQCAGMMIFLPVLCGAYIIAERVFNHENKMGTQRHSSD